jgi:tetratricopeptide (TPR) repeat protein
MNSEEIDRLYFDENRPKAALALARRLVATAREAHDNEALASGLEDLGRVLLCEERLRAARPVFEEALALRTARDENPAECCWGLARAEKARPRRARRWLKRALEVCPDTSPEERLLAAIFEGEAEASAKALTEPGDFLRTLVLRELARNEAEHTPIRLVSAVRHAREAERLLRRDGVDGATERIKVLRLIADIEAERGRTDHAKRALDRAAGVARRARGGKRGQGQNARATAVTTSDEGRLALQRFAEVAVSDALWFLKGRTSVEIPSSQRPGTWLCPLWLARALAKPTARGIVQSLQPVNPAQVSLAELVEDWLPKMLEDDVLIGISMSDAPCEWEVQPATLLASLAGASAELSSIVRRLPSAVKSAVREAPEAPLGPWKGWPEDSDLRPVKAMTTLQRWRAIECVDSDGVRQLLGFLDDQLERAGVACDHHVDRCDKWARDEGIDPDELLRGLRRLGLACDCEVRLNLADMLELDDEEK